MTLHNFVLLRGKKHFQKYNEVISQQELNDGLQFLCSCLTEKNQLLLTLLQVTNHTRSELSRNPFERNLTHIFNRLRSSIRSLNSDIRDGQLIVTSPEIGRQIFELTGDLRVSATDGSEEIHFAIGKSALRLQLLFRAKSKPVAINYIGHAWGRKGAPTTLRRQVEYVLSNVSKLELVREQLEHVNKDVDEDDLAANSQTAQLSAEGASIGDDVRADNRQSLFEQLRISAQAWVDKMKTFWEGQRELKRTQILATLFEGALWALSYSQVIGGNFNSRAWIPSALVTAAIALSKSNVVPLERSSHWFMATGGALFVVPTITMWVLNSSNNITKVVPLWVIVAVFQIRLAWSLSRRYLAAVDTSLSGYFDNESWFGNDSVAGGDSTNREDSTNRDRYEKLLRRAKATGFRFEAEGQSQLFLLIRMVFGVATWSSIVVSYFQIGQIYQQSGDNLNNFIFENNEGFTAALSLLIVVLTTAAVQTYSDLVDQIRQEDDRFERAVSSLKQALMNVDSHMKRIWEHLSAAIPEDKLLIDQRLCQLLNNQTGGNSYITVLERYCSRPTAELQQGLRPSLARLSAWQEIGYVESDASRVGDPSVRESWRRWHSLELSRSGRERQISLTRFLQRPPDEKSIYLLLNLDRGEARDFSEMELVFTRLLVRVNRHRQHWMDDNVLQFCNELDLDASYLLDDLLYFDQIFNSIQGYVFPSDYHSSSSNSNPSSRELLAENVRTGEVARTLNFFAWFTFLQNRKMDQTERSPEQAGTPLDAYISEFFFSQVVAAADELEIPNNHEARLLLMLSAAQRTQLHNLIRSALASRRRTLLSQFEDALDDYRAPRHFAIPVVPRFSNRISHLQFFLGVSRKSQRPIRLTPNMDVIEADLRDTDIEPLFALAHQLRYVTVDRERATELYRVKTKWDRVISALGFTANWTKAVQISAQTWSDLSTDPFVQDGEIVLDGEIDERNWTDYPPRWRLALANWYQDRTFEFNTQVANATVEDQGAWVQINRSFWLVLTAFASEEDGIEFTSEPDQRPSRTDVDHIISIVNRETEEDLINKIWMFCQNADREREIRNRLFPGPNSQSRMDDFLGKNPQ